MKSSRSKGNRSTGSRLRPIAFVILATVGSGLSACTHQYSNAHTIRKTERESVVHDLVLVGVLYRDAAAGRIEVSQASTRSVHELSNVEVSRSPLPAADLTLLLSEPALLALEAPRLLELRKQLERRYVLVGEARGVPTLEKRFWNPLIILPIPYVTVWFTVPIQTSATPDVPHEMNLLRVIDLEEARIISEWCEVTQHDPLEREFAAGSVADGLASMGLR